MKDFRASRLIEAALLAALATAVTSTPAVADPSDSIQLLGIVRDFRENHADFGVVPAEGFGHCAGNVALVLDNPWVPEYIGSTVPAGPVAAPLASGSYVGNAVDSRAISGVGFRPDVVIIKGNATRFAVSRTSTMAGDTTKRLADPQSVVADRIQSLDADGFTIGTNSDVNGNGTTFHWMAFAALADALAVGSYTGDGQDDRYLTSPGFRPDYVIVLPEYSYDAYAALSSMPSGRSAPFGTGNPTTNRIQGMIANGFQVGSNSDVNHSGRTYHYVCWKAIPGYMNVGTYTGNGSDNRDIMGAGLLPQYMIVKGDDDHAAVHRSMAQGVGDFTLNFRDAANMNNAIQSLNNDGFQVGTRSEVNSDDDEYYWAAFADGRPSRAPYQGYMVGTEWRNRDSKPMAPHLQGYGAQQQFTNYQLVGKTITPGQSFGAMFTVLGAAIESGSEPMPVTTKVRIGSATFEPFGTYLDPVSGNVNDDQSNTGWANPGNNPRQIVLPGTYAAGSAVSVVGQSWSEDGSDWESSMEVDSLTGSSQVIMLKNGDLVPDYEAFQSQANLAEYVDEYIVNGRIALCNSQVIFLFELGVSASSSSADFQDLVVLVTLAEDPASLPGTGGCGADASSDNCGNPITDTAGAVGTPSAGAIQSSATFGQWFHDTIGVNFSGIHTITLENDGSGVYEYATAEFHPIDGQLLGNESTHNNYFTYEIEARFAYQDCGSQFFEFQGADDCWMYVDNQLVIDLGGIKPGVNQLVELDRLNLHAGQWYSWRLFYAQRHQTSAEFQLRTNVPLVGSSLAAISAPND